MRRLLLPLLVFCFLTGILQAEENISIDNILAKTIAGYETVQDYACIFNKKEFVNGKIKDQNNIINKFKKPVCIYLRWTEGSDKGNEAIYVLGKYKNELQVHLGGFLNIYMSRATSIPHPG
jgi:hypothetical protein